MNRCIAAYWKPVFYFLRANHYPLHQAEDLTQEFFLRFCERDWIRRADEKRGRFRNFLLSILVRFLADQGKTRAPRQQTFDAGQVTISALMGDSERNFEPPEQVFMQGWAQAVIACVLRRVELHCSERGRPDWYRMFCEIYFPGPGSPRVTQQALADRLDVTREQVRYGLDEVHGLFIQCFREEVAGQLGAEDDLDTEIRELEVLLAG